MFEAGLEISIFFYACFESRKTQQKIGNRVFFFTLFWLLLISGFIYLFYKLNFRVKRKSKKAISREREIINQEVNHSVLISSMGLEDDYIEKQRISTSHSARRKFSVKTMVGLELAVLWKLLVYLFPFGLLIIEGPRFIGTNLFII
jgi:predicted membrane protein